MYKKLIMIILILSFCTYLISPVFASEYNFTIGGNNLGDRPFDIGNKPEEEKIAEMTSRFLGYIQWFGYAIAIGMLIYVGIKYVMSPANERANLKSSLSHFIIGAVFIGGASVICTAIKAVVESGMK